MCVCVPAGSIMYEYGMRLGREGPGLKGLQHQAKCYLAALNALRLVDPKYAWIVKPLTASTQVPTLHAHSYRAATECFSWPGELSNKDILTKRSESQSQQCVVLQY